MTVNATPERSPSSLTHTWPRGTFCPFHAEPCRTGKPYGRCGTTCRPEPCTSITTMTTILRPAVVLLRVTASDRTVPMSRSKSRYKRCVLCDDSKRNKNKDTNSNTVRGAQKRSFFHTVVVIPVVSSDAGHVVDMTATPHSKTARKDDDDEVIMLTS